jgi:hypothetical protein
MEESAKKPDPRSCGSSFASSKGHRRIHVRLYPICVAHANDRMPSERATAVGGRLILIAGIGSTFGPLRGSSVTSTCGIHCLFEYMAAVAVLFSIFALARGVSSRPPLHQAAKTIPAGPKSVCA